MAQEERMEVFQKMAYKPPRAIPSQQSGGDGYSEGALDPTFPLFEMRERLQARSAPPQLQGKIEGDVALSHLPSFDSFWREYPRRVGRLKAEKIWLKLSAEEQKQALRGTLLWKQTDQWHQADGQFIPYASTFLAQKRYLDEPWTGAFTERQP